MTGAASKCATILHVSAFPIYAFTLYVTLYKLAIPLPDPKYEFAGRWKFLTIWNHAMCVFYFGLCLVLKAVPLKFLIRVRDYVFCSVSLPSSIFVTCSFWGIYAFDPELILPKQLAAVYPWWLNHTSHTLVIVTAVLDALLQKHKVPSTRGGLVGMVTWFLGYLAWILYLGNVKDVWVYPILRALPAAQLTLLFIFNGIGLVLLYLACISLLRCINRKQEDDADLELKKVI